MVMDVALPQVLLIRVLVGLVIADLYHRWVSPRQDEVRGVLPVNRCG
jgi:hypothetical protein